MDANAGLAVLAQRFLQQFDSPLLSALVHLVQGSTNKKGARISGRPLRELDFPLEEIEGVDASGGHSYKDSAAEEINPGFTDDLSQLDVA